MNSTTDAAQPGTSNHLLRILGVGFGLAIVIGGTVGVGILRSPGPIAEQLGSVWLIMLAWTLGGVYSLLGANYLAELATMTPKAGGYFVYARRAYGSYGGFVVGWSDWLYNTLAIPFIAVVFGEYCVALFGTSFPGDRILFSVSILVVLTLLNWIGLRTGSATQKITSLLKTVALVGFVIACFVFGGTPDASTPVKTLESVGGFASIVAFVLAFQLILSTYDGWHSVIYFAEEDTNPKQNIPRSLFGGIAIVTLIYLLINVALLYVLPFSKLAGSKFAGGDAISLIFGARSGQIVTILALLSLIGILNAVLMLVPRIMLALGREGFFTKKAAEVNKGGTPVFGLFTTAIVSIVLSMIGTFEMLMAVSQFFAVTITILLIISLFILRRNEPEAPRPYKAWGYPYAPAVMLVGAVLLFFGYIFSNPYPSAYAIALLVLSYPIFLLIRSRRPMD
jgi:APA family basic amino acid/polyamine antiporter